MLHSSAVPGSRRGMFRPTLLLLLAAIIGGLLQPLLPAPTAAAQPRPLSPPKPALALKAPKSAPEALTASQSTTQQTSLFNVAVGKKATQTNDNPFVKDPYHTTVPLNAIDGNTDGIFGNGSVTTSWGNNHDPLDWWQVDLGGSYPITRIDLWNRTDCCAERLRDVYVLVSDVPFTSNVLADNLAQPGVGAYFQSGILGRTTPFTVGRSGRFVRVVLSQRGPLTLAEVQVWSTQATATTPATDPINVAEGRTATQSSTSYGGTPDRAVDSYVSGHYPSGTVTFAGGSATPDWWQVDLGGIYPITSIDLWNRTDCCADYLRDFHVFVSDTPFATNDPAQLAAQPTIGNTFTAGVAGRRTTVTVGRTGRYVRVALSKPGILMLAEVQVWSQSRTPVGTRASEPTLVAWPRNGEMYLTWPKVGGATSYTLERADNVAGPYSLIATGITRPIVGIPWYEYSDKPRTNDVFAFYRVTAFDEAGRVVNRSDVLKAKPTTTATTSFDAYSPMAATSYTAAYAMVEQNDTVLGRPVMNAQGNTHYVALHNVNFGTVGANGFSLRYRASAPGTVSVVAQPANLTIASVALTQTNGLWRSENMLIQPTKGTQTIYVFFASQGAGSLQLDQFQFSAPGPFDTATLKWDPNIVLLHKSMGIALNNYALDQADMTMLMRFSTTTTEGRSQFAKLKAGSVIASDTNLDLGGPYARVTQVVSINDSEVAVKAAALAFNDLIYAGSFDAKAAIQQAINTAMDASVGTSAKGPAFSANGYDTTFPTDVTYYNSADMTNGQGAGSSQSFRQTRTAGMGMQAAQSSTPGIPTTLPPEAKNSPKGTFHVTMDNAQFVKDENGWGVELVNVKMNGLGIAPFPSGAPGSNPIAAQFGFGVLGGVGAEKLMLQTKIEVDKGVISRNEMFSVKTQVTGTARFQAKGLAVALWFWEVPLKWIKPIRFVVPTAVGPIPCSIGFGVQGFIMGVGAGNMVAEKGYQVKLTQGGQPGKEVQVSDFGETKIEFGQRADNVSLFGVFFEPYIKVRVGTFAIEEVDPAVAQQLLGWMGHWVKLSPEQLKKMEGFFVFTFTPRVYYMMLLQNWKNKDRPIHEQKVCVGPIVKAEALPGFPLPVTFELRLEGPPYCVAHETWLQYDMQVPEGVLIDPSTGKGKATWGVPIVSERSYIPYSINVDRLYPYSEPGAPKVVSTNIADAWFNAAERRRCLIFRKPLSQLDPVDIAYNGPCKPQMTTEVALPVDRTDATFMLRVLTEYRNPFTPTDAEMIKNEYAGGGALPWGVWSDKPFQVVRPNDTTTFKVNATEVFSDSARTLGAIEGTECDPEGRRALGMTLEAAITVVDPTLTKLEDVALQVDGVDVAVRYLQRTDTGWQLKTDPINLFAGAHTMTIVAKEKALLSNSSFTVRYSATFKAQAKACGRAKPDDRSAVVYENSRCSQQQSPEIPLDVLGNDDWSGDALLTITSVTPARLGSVRIGPGGQTLRYKPSSVGVDSFAYTVTISPRQGQVFTATTSVLVTNRLASTDADCAGGGGSGGSPNAGGSGSGTISNWGDPHISTADGLSFDSHAFGEFIYLRPKAGQTGLTVHGRQQMYKPNSFAAVTTALAFKLGDQRIEFRALKTPAILVNGVAPTATWIDFGGGATLTIGTPTSYLTLPGMTIEVTRRGTYLDTLVKVPLDNTHQGMWGTPNGNRADDWTLPDGSAVSNPFALADGWRITQAADSLFTYDANESPATYNMVNARAGEIPTAEQLAPFVTQARSLLSAACDTGDQTLSDDDLLDLALELYIGTPSDRLMAQLCTYQISGTVTSTNPAGAPVAGVSVNLTSPQLQSCSTATDKSGRYSCTLVPQPNISATPTITVTVAGTLAQSVTFPVKAPARSTLSRVIDLAVTRPTIRLALRSLDAAGAPLPSTTLEVKSGSFIQRVTTSPTGTASLVLSYDIGKTSEWVYVEPVFPARGNTFAKNVTLSPTSPVDLAADLTLVRLDTPRWRVLADNSFRQNDFPIIDRVVPALGPDGTIYTVGHKSEGSTYGRLMAFGPDGQRKWLSAPGTSLAGASISTVTPVVGVDGTIYVSGENYPNAYLYAFTPAGGLKWTYTAPSGFSKISARPALGADGTLYITIANTTNNEARLVALDPADATARWSGSYSDIYVEQGPVVAPDGTLYAFGQKARRFSANGVLLATSNEFVTRARPLVGADGSVYVTWSARADDGGPRTIAFNPDLTQRWSVPVGSLTGAALGTDGFVYVPARDGLRKLDPATGATVWTVSGEVESGVVVGANGVVYVQVRVRGNNIVPDIGELLGVRADGTVASRFKLNGTLTLAPVMGTDGTLYTGMYSPEGGYDLWAIPTASTSGPATGWSSIYGNPQNTGRRTP